MKIISQWRVLGKSWGIGLFTVFADEHYCGFCLLGFVFEFPRTRLARDIHGLMQ